MLNFSGRALLALFIFVCVTSAAAQSPSTTTSPPNGQTKVVVIPMFGDDAASKWRGAWVDETAYKKSDIIEFDGSSYIAVADHQSDLLNIPPADGLWNVVAASGANGAAGSIGNTGAKGEPGAAGAVGGIGNTGAKGEPGIQGMTGPQGTAANAVDAICVALGSTAGCDLEAALAPAFPKLVFVTSTLQNGNLGGLEGADDICQDLADVQDIQGVFKAWLSDSTRSPFSRFNHAITPYALVDGTVIAVSWADLVEDGPPQHGISLTEAGGGTGTQVVYTGTDYDGRPFGGSCDDWSSSDAQDVIVGISGATGFKWSAAQFGRCDALNRLYCFEQ
jgi:hypothetical protein